MNQLTSTKDFINLDWFNNSNEYYQKRFDEKEAETQHRIQQINYNYSTVYIRKETGKSIWKENKHIKILYFSFKLKTIYSIVSEWNRMMSLSFLFMRMCTSVVNLRWLDVLISTFIERKPSFMSNRKALTNSQNPAIKFIGAMNNSVIDKPKKSSIIVSMRYPNGVCQSNGYLKCFVG